MKKKKKIENEINNYVWNLNWFVSDIPHSEFCDEN